VKKTIVSSGVVSSGLTLFGPLDSVDMLIVDSGGTLIDTTVDIGWLVEVKGGVTSGIIVSYGGTEDILSGTDEYSIVDGGTQTVDGTAIGTIVNGGEQTVEGLAIGSVINDGLQSVFEGVASNTSIGEYGEQFVELEGVAISTFVGDGGSSTVDMEGVSSDTVVASGGLELVGGGGLAGGTAVNSFGTLIVSGGPFGSIAVASGAVIDFGALAFVSSGGVVSATTVESGGGLAVLPGGSAIDTVVQAGGVVVSHGVLLQDQTKGVVDQGLATSDTAVGSGEVQYVLSVGETISTSLSSGGHQYVYAGGTAVDTSLTFVASQTVYSGGTATDTILNYGGFEDNTGGTIIDQTVNAGGYALDDDSGTEAGTVIGSAGVVFVGSTTFTDATVESGGLMVFEGDSTISDVTVSSGGLLLNTSGQSLSGVNVLPGGLVVTAGVLAYDPSSGVTYNSTNVTSANIGLLGLGYVLGGGTLTDPVIADLGETVVESGGVVIDAKIGSDGFQEVALGSSLSSFVGNGGYEEDFGTVRDATVASGGVEAFAELDGASLIDTTLLVGGSIDFDSVLREDVSVSFDDSTNMLTVSNPDQSASIHLLGDYTGDSFVIEPQTDVFTNLEGSGTRITLDGTPCYCRGTHIATATGESLVEDLRVGDQVRTAAGALRPIRWIGRRCYLGTFANGNPDVLPITLRAGALEDGVPARDLSVSPLHAMFLDGVLIPAAALVNGESITQAEAIDSVEYFHVELDSHDVILAEGAASETFVDDGSRSMFHNAADYTTRYPDAPLAPAVYCAPRIEHGPLLEAVRQRLADRLHPPVLRACRGYLEQASRGDIIGWACDDADPLHRVTVRLRDCGVAIGEVRADRPRADLQAANIGDGAHGFCFSVPGGLSPLERHVITAEVIGGAALIGTCELAPGFITVPVPDASLLTGHVDLVSRARVLGWAADPAAPHRALGVQVLVDGSLAAGVLANRYRRDVAQAGIGTGRHAFEFHFVPPLSPLRRHVVELRLEATGQSLAPPAVLEPASWFDPDLEAAVDAAVAALGNSGTERHVLSFLEAQAERLRQLSADAQSGAVARQHAIDRRRANQAVVAPALRALIIDAEWPDPTRDAGSQAILSHLHALQQIGYTVSFVAARQMHLNPPDWLERAGAAPCAQPFFASVEDVLRRQEGCFDLVYLHRVDTAAKYLALARAYQPHARILYAVADLHHVRLARQAAVEDRPELLIESRRLRQAECHAAASADATLTHSPHEAAILRALVPGAAVHVVPWHIPATAVTAPLHDRHGIAFIGNYAHAPNVDAARYLAEEIMPLVWRSAPDLPCLLVGRGAPQRLQRPGIEIVGHVDDLAQVFNRVRLTVAPLRYGAGIKGKVLASLAAGIPCVATPIASEGLDLPESLLARDADELAASILRLHAGDAPYRDAAIAGRHAAQAYMAGTSERLDAAIGGALRRSHASVA
jgi:autotransporter passenger strand-loop-strand repeat protein